MEHKPIYLDGVDVSECKCLHNVKVITELAQPEDFEILCGATNGAIKCEKWKDCYFKQLARKTQECEQIKEKYEALKLENQEGYEIVAELKHECEELKDKLKIYEKMFDNSEFRVALTDIGTGERDIREQRDKRLTKENEELKRKVELMMDCPDCKVDEYKKALEEIEEYCITYSDNHDAYKTVYKYILDIINEAKGEGNE